MILICKTVKRFFPVNDVETRHLQINGYSFDYFLMSLMHSFAAYIYIYIYCDQVVNIYNLRRVFEIAAIDLYRD